MAGKSRLLKKKRQTLAKNRLLRRLHNNKDSRDVKLNDETETRSEFTETLGVIKGFSHIDNENENWIVDNSQVTERIFAEKESFQMDLKNDMSNSVSMDNSLIAAVYTREALWNPANELHKNSNILRKLWEEIADELQKDVKSLKTRWKNLRTYFIKECQKLEKSKNKHGSGIRTWQYFDQLQFLRNSTSVLNKIAEDEDDEDYYNEYCDASIFLEQSSPAHSSVSDNLTLAQQMKRQYESNDQTGDHVLDFKRRKIELLEKEFNRRSDDDLLFFESLLPYIKNMPPARKLSLRSKIQELIINELEDIEKEKSAIQDDNKNEQEIFGK